MRSRRRPAALVIAALAASGVMATAAVAPARADEETPAGRAAFLDHRCNVCHAVEAAGIEAKAKEPGPDLTGYSTEDLAALGRYLRKEEARDGEDHTKTFKGTDEELAVIVDWLASLAAEEGS